MPAATRSPLNCFGRDSKISLGLSIVSDASIRQKRSTRARAHRRLIGHDPSKKGAAQRCVERIAEFANSDLAIRQLRVIADRDRLPVHVQHELSYAIVKQCTSTYPTREEYYVAAPGLVRTKARGSITDFDDDWSTLHDLYCGQDDIPNLFTHV